MKNKFHLGSCTTTTRMAHTCCRTNPTRHTRTTPPTRTITHLLHTFTTFVNMHNTFSKSSILSVFLFFTHSCIYGRIYALYYTFMPYKRRPHRFHFSLFFFILHYIYIYIIYILHINVILQKHVIRLLHFLPLFVIRAIFQEKKASGGSVRHYTETIASPACKW